MLLAFRLSSQIGGLGGGVVKGGGVTGPGGFGPAVDLPLHHKGFPPTQKPRFMPYKLLLNQQRSVAFLPLQALSSFFFPCGDLVVASGARGGVGSGEAERRLRRPPLGGAGGGVGGDGNGFTGDGGGFTGDGGGFTGDDGGSEGAIGSGLHHKGLLSIQKPVLLPPSRDSNMQGSLFFFPQHAFTSGFCLLAKSVTLSMSDRIFAMPFSRASMRVVRVGPALLRRRMLASDLD